MNIKPGDLFRFVYVHDNSPVIKNEELYSYSMGKWVPCGGLCLCVGINTDNIHWFYGGQLFRVRPHTFSPSRGFVRSPTTQGRGEVKTLKVEL